MEDPGWSTRSSARGLDVSRIDRGALRQQFKSRGRRCQRRCCSARTYEGFASRVAVDAMAITPTIHTMPNYVVSSTRPTRVPTRRGSAADFFAEVSKLKDSLAGEIVVHGSGPAVSMPDRARPRRRAR